MSTFNLFQRRKELNLTLEDVGKHVGVSKSTVKKWETGYIENMKRDKIALLAEVLQVSPLTIMGFEDTPNKAISQNFTNYKLSKDESQLITNYRTLDDIDKAEIRGEMKQMLKADKYN